jgi:hypothetical protein
MVYPASRYSTNIFFKYCITSQIDTPIVPDVITHDGMKQNIVGPLDTFPCALKVLSRKCGIWNVGHPDAVRGDECRALIAGMVRSERHQPCFLCRIHALINGSKGSGVFICKLSIQFPRSAGREP